MNFAEKGHDDDFGKAAEKMHPIIEPPFKAVTYDTLKHTSVEDVSCMRLLVTMGGLVTDTNARVLDDDLNPIQGLYAVGNVQGGRFVDDYPFSLSGASHAAALTYGYLAGRAHCKRRNRGIVHSAKSYYDPPSRARTTHAVAPSLQAACVVRCRQSPYLHGPIPLRVHEWRKALQHGVIEKVDLRQKLAERASKNIGKLMPCRLAMSA